MISDDVVTEVIMETAELEPEGRYSERMVEKAKREMNTMLYTRNYYCYAYDVKTSMNTINRYAEGVLGS